MKIISRVVIWRASPAGPLTTLLGEVNAIHPFREGNGRTQREFIRTLAHRNGLTIDWRQISQEEMIEASRRSLRVDNTGLEQILKKALENDPSGRRG